MWLLFVQLFVMASQGSFVSFLFSRPLTRPALEELAAMSLPLWWVCVCVADSRTRTVISQVFSALLNKGPFLQWQKQEKRSVYDSVTYSISGDLLRVKTFRKLLKVGFLRWKLLWIVENDGLWVWQVTTPIVMHGRTRWVSYDVETVDQGYHVYVMVWEAAVG